MKVTEREDGEVETETTRLDRETTRLDRETTRFDSQTLITRETRRSPRSRREKTEKSRMIAFGFLATKERESIDVLANNKAPR